MTSRRSRLKAVANLPVRRKPPTLQGSGEEIKTPDSISPEKIPSAPKANEVIGSTSNGCQNYESLENISSNDLQGIGSKGIQDSITSKNNTSDVQSSKNVALEQHDELIIAALENNNDTNKNTNLVGTKNNFGNSTSFRCSRRFKPNLVSSLSKEKIQLSVLEKNTDNQNLQPPSNFVCGANNNNSLEEKLKCSNMLSSETTSKAITQISIPISGSSNPLNDINTSGTTSNFNEVSVYTEIVDSPELFINSPTFISNGINDGNEFVIDSEQSEPTFTTLVNCSVDKEIDGLHMNLNNDGSNLTQLKNVTHDVFVKPATRNGVINDRTNIIRSEEFSMSSINPVRDKTILESLVSSTAQNLIPDTNSFNTTVKRTISTLKRKRSKCNDFTKKLADARREFQKKYEKTKPDRSTLKMIDLIFYNPTTNPMESKTKYDKKDTSSMHRELVQEMLAEEGVDEPEAMDCGSRLQPTDDNDSENMNRMPVPQVKIGLNGEIILDEKSLIIETTEAKKGREDLQNSVPIFEDKGSKVSYYRGKTRKTRDWTDFETKRFYKALNTIGPDFSLMQKYFPKRSRLELKNKFKREERLNRNLIDKALNNPSEFDMTQLEKDLAVERKAEEEEEVEMRLRRGTKEKSAPKRSRSKSSLLSREMIESDGESEDGQSRSDAVNSKRLSQIEKDKKKKEINFIFQKFVLKESEKQINELPEISSPSACVFRPTNHGVT